MEMLEPLLQDYFRLCAGLDRDAFVKRTAPVLIAKAVRDELTFQAATTEMLGYEKYAQGDDGKSELKHTLPVIELRVNKPSGVQEMSIGRSEENDVVIHDETVSSRHAVFFKEAGSGIYMIYDLESTNGTTINGTALVPGRAVELRDRDNITFGDAEFVFFSPGGLYDEIQRIIKTPTQVK
jgi:pSer/pThr/pTyr-binding forkhead associated (FHA) protein